jgi:hypothetical protein
MRASGWTATALVALLVAGCGAPIHPNPTEPALPPRVGPD